MKIVHVVQTLGLGGLETLVLRIGIALRTTGHEVEVIALSEGGAVVDKLQASGIPVKICHPPVRTLGDLIRLRTMLLAMRPDVIHLHGLPCGTLGRSALIGSGVRTLYHLHTAVSSAHRPTPGMRLREKLLSLLPGKIVAVSESVRQDYTNTFLIPASRITVLPGGVPDKPLIDRKEARANLGLPEAAFILAMIASLTPVKRHIDALNALAQVPEAQLLLVGVGPLRGDIQEQIERLGLTDRVQLLGHRDDIHELFSAADVALLVSSPREGLGLSLIEAQRAGIPAIGTDIGGIPEVLQDGETGLLVDAENPDALATAIRRLKGDPALCHKMGQAARLSFEERFTMEKYLAELLILYRG